MIKTLLAIFLSFSKIGVVSLGGGNSMLMLIEYEAVDHHHWITSEEFVNMVSSSFLFPGLTVVKLTALIGYKAAGIPGVILAVFCMSLPGLILALIGYHYLINNKSAFTDKIMQAVQYGAMAMLAGAVFSVAQGVMNTNFSLPLAIAGIVFFIALTYLQLSPFWGFIAFIGIGFFLAQP